MLVIKRLEQRLAPRPEKAEIVLRITGHKPIVITVCEAHSGFAKLGILAPPEVLILRGELDLISVNCDRSSQQQKGGGTP